MNKNQEKFLRIIGFVNRILSTQKNNVSKKEAEYYYYYSQLDLQWIAIATDHHNHCDEEDHKGEINLFKQWHVEFRHSPRGWSVLKCTILAHLCLSLLH